MLAKLPRPFQAKGSLLTLAVSRCVGKPFCADVDDLVLPLDLRAGPEATVAIVHPIEDPCIAFFIAALVVRGDDAEVEPLRIADPQAWQLELGGRPKHHNVGVFIVDQR